MHCLKQCLGMKAKWNPSSLFFDTIIYSLLDRYKRDNKLKELLKISCLYEVIVFYVQTWLISHAKTRRAVSSSILARWFHMIRRNVFDIIIFIYLQKSTATDQYSSSYGPANFDDAMASFEVKTRQAITLWILVHCRRFLHSNARNDVVCCRFNRGATARRREQMRRNIVAWR